MDYSNILFLFIFVFIYLIIGSSFFRAEGNVKRSTQIVFLSGILNIVCDPIFIYIFNLGMKGAAIATVISSIIPCALIAYWIWIKKDNYLKLTYKQFKLDLNIIKDIISLAIPATLETTITSILSISLNFIIIQVSNHVSVAVFTSSMQIVQFTTIPLNAIATALLTVAGISYGAKNFKNLRIAHSYSIRIGFLLAIGTAILMLIFAPHIATIFSYSNKSVGLTPKITSALYILSLYVIVMPHGIMSTTLFRAIGKGLYSLILTILTSLLLQLVCILILCFILGWGLNGIYAGLIFGSSLGSLVGYVWAKIFIIKKKKKKDLKEYIHEKKNS